jgi:mono/diheme cytochrome c family protein
MVGTRSAPMQKLRQAFLAVASLAIGLAGAPALASDPSQASSPTWIAPARAARKLNPLAQDLSAAARGKSSFATACVPCHGLTGKGDGPAGAFLMRAGVRVHPRDLTDPVLWEEPDGALFWKISEGKAPMPSFHETFTEDQLWEIVAFVRTLAPRPSSTNTTNGGE